MQIFDKKHLLVFVNRDGCQLVCFPDHYLLRESQTFNTYICSSTEKVIKLFIYRDYGHVFIRSDLA